jgi:hypothetical protein
VQRRAASLSGALVDPAFERLVALGAARPAAGQLSDADTELLVALLGLGPALRQEALRWLRRARRRALTDALVSLRRGRWREPIADATTRPVMVSPETGLLALTRGRGPRRLLVVANFSDQDRRLPTPLAPGRWRPVPLLGRSTRSHLPPAGFLFLEEEATSG